MGGEDDRVDRRLELGQRVADSSDRIGLDDEAVRGDSFVPEQRQRPVEPPPRCGAPRVLVDDVAALRLVHRAR